MGDSKEFRRSPSQALVLPIDPYFDVIILDNNWFGVWFFDTRYRRHPSEAENYYLVCQLMRYFPWCYFCTCCINAASSAKCYRNNTLRNARNTHHDQCFRQHSSHVNS
jgi:hypothetical protein